MQKHLPIHELTTKLQTLCNLGNEIMRQFLVTKLITFSKKHLWRKKDWKFKCTNACTDYEVKGIKRKRWVKVNMWGMV